jgi:hypothetical protein
MADRNQSARTRDRMASLHRDIAVRVVRRRAARLRGLSSCEATLPLPPAPRAEHQHQEWQQDVNAT